MERQRLAEWEKQRKAELVQHRQREQEKVLELKAKKENLDTEFETMVRMMNLKLEVENVKIFVKFSTLLINVYLEQIFLHDSA